MAQFRFTQRVHQLAALAGLDASDPRLAHLLALLEDRDREIEDYLSTHTH